MTFLLPHTAQTSRFQRLLAGRIGLSLRCLFVVAGLLTLPPFISSADAQRHPMEIGTIYPLGGSAGTTTRVTITGLSLRNAGALVFNTPTVTAKIVPPDPASLPAQTPDSDGNPPVVV